MMKIMSENLYNKINNLNKILLIKDKNIIVPKIDYI